MTKQIRLLGLGLMLCFAALFVQLNVLQVVRADDYNNDRRNRRAVDRDFEQQIVLRISKHWPPASPATAW